MNALLLLAALAAQAAQALPTPGTAGGLELVFTDEDGEMRIDPASIRRDGDVARVDTITMISTPRPDGIIAAVARIAIDCPRQTFFFELLATYTAAGLSAERSFAFDAREMEPFGQHRALDIIAERVCPPAAAAPAQE